MEKIIDDFKYWGVGTTLRSGIHHAYIESPKGEFGVTMVTNNTQKPSRLKVKSPAYFNMQFCPVAMAGNMLADLVMLIGSIDVVFGEIDR
jgi:NADH-quinone oxidoreductase subunit D